MMKKLPLLLVAPLALSAISDQQFSDLQRAQRQVEAHTVKSNVAMFDEDRSVPSQTNNGDQQLYSDLRGSFNKGLNHLMSGFPLVSAYNSLVKALGTARPQDFREIDIGIGTFKLVNPQGSFAFSLAGNDGWIYSMPPAPTFASAQTAADMVELYWTAIIRDEFFNEYDMNNAVHAATSLTMTPGFTGPKIGGVVTDGTLLRGNLPGDLIGPYISQFLYQNIPFGALGTMANPGIGPELVVPTSGDDFNFTFADWFTTVSGGDTGNSITPVDAPFIRNARDLAEYVHNDSPAQAASNALLLLLSYGDAALDPANPYVGNGTQVGFTTFGVGEFQELLRTANEAALEAAWYQKWQVHRRLRPEEFGFYADQQIIKGNALGISSVLEDLYNLDPDFMTDFEALFGMGTLFLPVSYPEGSPVHPSYPAGHATCMGAAVTILKAIFNEDFEIPSPLEPNATNDALVAFVGTLTVGNELNKLASNIALGRDHAGVHYRSDSHEGILLGEKIAIDVLNNSSFLFNEKFPDGYTLHKFDGTVIRVGKKRKTF